MGRHVEWSSSRPGAVVMALVGNNDTSAAPTAGAPKKRKASTTTSSPPSPNPHALPQKRTVCDNCRQRRVRCDGEFPCRRCLNANLTCKRDHVPRKRGPKPGHGKVIDGLRARGEHDAEQASSASQMNLSDEALHPGDPSLSGTLPSLSPPTSWTPPRRSPTLDPSATQSPFTTDQYRPTSRHYFDLIPRCVDLYYEHIYPIMPLVYMPELRSMISRPLSTPEKRFIYALCALTALHMPGKNINAPGPAPWESIGRFFVDESISARQSYDFEEDVSLPAIMSSFWLSTSFFELNQSKKSWYYLKEALSLALDLGLDNDAKYVGLTPEEILCRQRVFWILFVTERSFAILRRKPLTFTRTPSLPTTHHDYENPEIHAGFLKLIFSYAPLDSAFVNAWNQDGANIDPALSAATYLALQDTLAQAPTSPINSPTGSPGRSARNTPDDDPEPTAIQKADLLMTQQWLRLIVWRSSLQCGLLSTNAVHPSMRFSFPMVVARDTAAVLAALPPKAVEVHGMGIFEKIFEIGSTCVEVMGACKQMSSSPGGELELLSLSRKCLATDPVEFFVRALSASPNSRTQFADRLLKLANERPGAMRMSISPGIGLAGGSGLVVKNEGILRPPGVSVKEGNVEDQPQQQASTMALPLIKTEFGLSGPTGPGLCQQPVPNGPSISDPLKLPMTDSVESAERSSAVCYMGEFQEYVFGDAFKAL